MTQPPTRPTETPVFETSLHSLQRIARGKVRDIYHVDERHLLIIATDRISAFDVVLPDPVPGKGKVLTAISKFWFDRLAHIIPNHLTDIAPEDVLSDARDHEVVRDRAVVVRRLQPLPIEAVVRGYLIGSGWKDYCGSGRVSGVPLPPGIELAEQLREPIFTPSTKAPPGGHDENITMAAVKASIGRELADHVEQVSLQIYREANDYARGRGIIIADTKFEFGTDDGELKLIDELLTPDSSRFWPADSYEPGASPKSFDKQYVRDYLETLDWNKSPPGPRLPDVVIERTQEKYLEALHRLTAA